MKHFIFIGLIAFLMISCEKSNVDIYQDYIGVWSNTNGNLTRTLEVRKNGKSFYSEHTEMANGWKEISFNGVFIIEGSILKIGFKKLTINKEPELKDGFWHLTLDDIEFQKH
jgi:hypothetical protein